MQKRPAWTRTTLLLLTLLQFSVPSAVAFADARLGEPNASPHFESHSTDSCVRVHPADCAFHRFLSAPFARASSVVLRVRDGRSICWAPLTPAFVVASSGITLPDSRGPPTLF